MKSNEIVDQWLVFSKTDLDTARFLLTNMKPTPLEIICYHCQQSAEKALKAILVANDFDIIKTHNLLSLYSSCLPVCNGIIGLHNELVPLNRYGTQPRYPQELEISIEETQKAVLLADKIFNVINDLF